MDFSAMNEFNIVRSEKFRTPLNLEKQIGLWVDRIGHGIQRKSPVKSLRILGLYATVYIEKGEGVFYSDMSGEIKIMPGDTILLYPDVPGIYYPYDEWESNWIVWHGPDTENLETLAFFRKDKPVVKGNRSAVLSAYKILAGIIDNEDTSSIFERRNIVLNMLLDLYRTSKEENSPDTVSLLEKAIAYMNNLYDKDISIKEFARYAGLSETHFRRLFKAHTGSSPKDFIISLKVSKAKEYLSTGTSIKETAELLGFKDIFYFMRLFKKVTGRAPGKFVSGNLS